MAITDEYKELKSKEKIELFDELFKLKEEKAVIDKRIKELEVGYKEDVVKAGRDLFFELPSGIKFSIKKSTRAGGYNKKLLDELFEDIDQEASDYKGNDSTIYTLRLDK